MNVKGLYWNSSTDKESNCNNNSTLWNCYLNNDLMYLLSFGSGKGFFFKVSYIHSVCLLAKCHCMVPVNSDMLRICRIAFLWMEKSYFPVDAMMNLTEESSICLL